MNRIIRTALALTLAASTAPIAGMAFAQQSTKPLEEQNGTTKQQPDANKADSSSQNGTTGQNGSATQKATGTENSGDASGKAGAETQTKQQQQQKSNDSTTTTQQNGQSNSSGTENTQTKSGSASEQNGQSGTESTTSKKGAPTQDKASGNTEQKSGSDIKVNITTEQRTEIRNVIVQEKIEPVSVDVDVNVGVVVPKKVHLHRLPARIVKLVPAYRSYQFFVLADGRIVIVEPSTYRVVYILTA